MASKVQPHARQAGFTLIEILCAVAILGFVALGIVGLFSHSIAVNASGYDYAQLSAVARQVIEEMQALPFDDASLVATGGTPQAWPDPTGTDRYRVRYQVTDFGVRSWNEVGDPGAGTPPEPATWPTPGVGNPANLKRITLTVEATGEQDQRGVRELVVSAIKVP